MPTTYCTPTAVRAAAAGRTLHEDDDALTAMILLAEKDLDMRLSDLPRGDATRKLDPTELNAMEVEAISDATAQQVLYRLHMGYAFFIESHQQVGGKDYSTKGAPPKFAPMATSILRSAGILASSGRAWGGNRGRIRTVSERVWTW